MELNIKITLPEDFSMLCDIFAIQPQLFLQKIVDQISLPHFYAHQHDHSKWSTLILLEYLDHEHEMNENERELNEGYLEKFSDILSEILDEGTADETEKAARELIRDWHKALNKERAKYLIENLPKPE